MGTALTRLETWKFLVGSENTEGKKLTKASLAKWSKKSSKVFECVFCGTRGSLAQMQVQGATACPKCQDYKGVIPYIPAWSDYGTN
jgi:Zn ribbon nucleic-acid-binding protein